MRLKKSLLLSLLAILIAVTATGLAWYKKWFRGPTSQEKKEEELVLDQSQREYIWQVEHHVLILSKFWFHDLADALSQADSGALKTFLAPEFGGSVLQQPHLERLAHPSVQVIRQKKKQGYPDREMDREALVAYLLDYRKIFSRPPKVKIFPKTFAPRDRDNLDSPWEGAGVLRMWGETEPGKPGEVVLHFHFQVPRPQRNHSGGWLTKLAVFQTQKAVAEKYFFRDVTRPSNVDPDLFHDNWNEQFKNPVTGGVYLCDFNRDGNIDILIHDPKSYALYQGLGDGTFRNVTLEMRLPQMPPPSPSFVCAGFVDIDNDGWEDLIMGGHIYRNENGKRFVDYTYRTNLIISHGAGGIIIGDFDRDGLVDIFITRFGKGKARSWLDGHSGQAEGNQLWRNLGNWKFEDVTARAKASGGMRSVFSAVWFDANNDRWPDLFVPNEFGNGVLLINQKDGTFREHSLTRGPMDFGTMGIACGDLNNDGHIDLYLANMYSKTGTRIIGNVRPESYPPEIMAKMKRFVSGSQLYLNHGNLDFEPVAQPWQINDVGWAYGPALVDFNCDGWLDIFATSGFMSFSRTEPDG